MITIIILSVILVICSALMLLIILMQRPKQEGLGASFGGGMTQDLFGAQTTNVLQKSTTYLAVGFFVIAMILAVLFNRQAEAAKSAEGLGLGDTPPPAVEEPAVPVTEEEAPTEEAAPTEGAVPAEDALPGDDDAVPAEEGASVSEPQGEALQGAAIGGVLGGQIENQSGAATGAVLGAAAGAIIGEQEAAEEVEETEETEDAEEAPAGQ